MEKEKRNALSIDREAGKLVGLLSDEKKNYIFGCGWMGQKFYDTVHAMGYKIDGFVVTKKNIASVKDVPIYSLEEIGMSGTEKNIFVALRDQDEELNNRLQEKFSVVYPVTYPKDITLIEAKYYLEFLKNRQVSCDERRLRLGKFDFVNPFDKADDYLLSWVYEAGDLILPIIYDDYSRIDEGPYEQEHTELERDDVVFDCGANIGLFTNLAVQKGCKVYAFEPMPDAISYLQELKDSHGEQMEICPYALADKCGKASFHVQNFDLLGASMLENNNTIDKDYEVEVTTIDTFVEQHHIERVDYIKADIEGSERDMIIGARRTIQKYHPKISICTYHLPDDKEVLEGLLKEIEPQYVVCHKWKKMYAYVPEEDND
jgi:FkbM family methyltransferase